MQSNNNRVMKNVCRDVPLAFQFTDGGSGGGGNGTLVSDTKHIALARAFVNNPEYKMAMQWLQLPTCEGAIFKKQDGDMPQKKRIAAILYNKNVMLRIYGPCFLLYARACQVLNVPMQRALLPPAPVQVIDLDAPGAGALLLRLAAPMPAPAPPSASTSDSAEWAEHTSTTTGKKYMYNKTTGESLYLDDYNNKFGSSSSAPN
mmetsp:Transcript_32646/g.97637  ORF Transcript_32646/g.97637 Transcript_32646/m.97637 type:complete len:203 (-) Transcript_32646:345-953(-)